MIATITILRIIPSPTTHIITRSTNQFTNIFIKLKFKTPSSINSTTIILTKPSSPCSRTGAKIPLPEEYRSRQRLSRQRALRHATSSPTNRMNWAALFHSVERTKSTYALRGRAFLRRAPSFYSKVRPSNAITNTFPKGIPWHLRRKRVIPA